jgi:LacI family transcriptional regulator
MNDIIAYGCIRALRDRDYKIPDDISVIGFDDLPSSSLTEPPLTAIRVSTQQIGMRALAAACKAASIAVSRKGAMESVPLAREVFGGQAIKF